MNLCAISKKSPPPCLHFVMLRWKKGAALVENTHHQAMYARVVAWSGCCANRLHVPVSSILLPWQGNHHQSASSLLQKIWVATRSVCCFDRRCSPHLCDKFPSPMQMKFALLRSHHFHNSWQRVFGNTKASEKCENVKMFDAGVNEHPVCLDLSDWFVFGSLNYLHRFGANFPLNGSNTHHCWQHLRRSHVNISPYLSQRPLFRSFCLFAWFDFLRFFGFILAHSRRLTLLFKSYLRQCMSKMPQVSRRNNDAANRIPPAANGWPTVSNVL